MGTIGTMSAQNISGLVFEGTIKSYANDTYVIDDNDKTFATWLHEQANMLEGRKVKIVIQDTI